MEINTTDTGLREVIRDGVVIGLTTTTPGAGICMRTLTASESDVFDVMEALDEADGQNFPDRLVVFRKGIQEEATTTTIEDEGAAYSPLWLPDGFEGKD